MPEAPTCGQGLAQHADFPRLMAQLLEAVAANLMAHLPSLAASDADTQREKLVYQQLAQRHRDAAAVLAALSEDMAGCSEMPMGSHDLDALSGSEMTDALTDMIRGETELLVAVEQQLTEHKAILDEMRSR
jgi:hypothetical protein